MIIGKKQIKFKDVIKKDLSRYTHDTGLKSCIRNLFINQGFRYIYIYRKVNWHKLNNNKLKIRIYRALLILFRIVDKYEIPDRATIGYGFYINHSGPIVINPNTIIGKNVNVHNGVTIGQQNRGKNIGSPIIGDNVWIGANAIIVGKVNIGNNVLIAPGSYVNFDVPNDSIVIGNPGVIKHCKYATESYIQNPI